MTEEQRSYTWSNPFRNPTEFMQWAKGKTGLACMQALMAGEIAMPPIASTLDYTLMEVEQGKAVFVCNPSEFHYNPIGVVHGGLAATLLDSALGCAVQTALPAGIGYTTIELHVNYIRGLTSETGTLRCEGKTIHVGRQTATAEAKLIDEDGKLYAHATTTCLVFPLPQK